MRVTPPVLAAVSAVAFPLALTAPLYSLLLLDILMVPLQGQTQIAGVLLDPSDVILGALGLGFLVRKRLSLKEIRRQVPFFGAWVTMGILMSIAYLTADKYQQHLTAIHRAVYQVFRFGWKPILFYPLAALLLGSIKNSRHVVMAIVIAGDICALMALPEGLRGLKAEGPFETGNSLGAALIVPFTICLGSMIVETSRRSRWLFGVSLLVLGRVLLWTGSRGATAGAVVGIAVVVGVMLSRSKGRKRLMKLAPLGLVAVLALFALKPDLLTRPTVRRAMTISDPMEQSTMQWRIEHRWSFFWDKAMQSPWFGFGTDIDDDLTAKGGAKTPHNGYLSLLVTYGLPATILYTFFGLLAVYSGMVVFRQSPIAEVSAIGLLTAAGLAGILTHNAVESVFTNNDWVNNVYWLLTGIGVTLVRQQVFAPGQEDGVQNSQTDSSPSERTLAARELVSGRSHEVLET